MRNEQVTSSLISILLSIGMILVSHDSLVRVGTGYWDFPKSQVANSFATNSHKFKSDFLLELVSEGEHPPTPESIINSSEFNSFMYATLLTGCVVYLCVTLLWYI